MIAEFKRESRGDGTRILTVRGEVDLSNAAGLQAEVFEAIDTGATRVIVDLSECGFLDSTALLALVRGNKRLEDTRCLVLIISTPPLLKLFEITGLARAFEVHATRDSALNKSIE
jgi:anti-sigma B factor antagonist